MTRVDRRGEDQVLGETARRETARRETARRETATPAHNRADADPALFPDATVEGAFVLDPWYRRPSGRFQRR